MKAQLIDDSTVVVTEGEIRLTFQKIRGGGIVLVSETNEFPDEISLAQTKVAEAAARNAFANAQVGAVLLQRHLKKKSERQLSLF